MITETKIKEKPILFNGEMVRAVLDGRKTQTRRVLKVQPPDDRYTMCQLMCSTDRELTKHKYKHHWCIVSEDKLEIKECGNEYFKSPYGYKGDQLWVRETFAIECNADLQDVYTEPNNPLGPVRNVLDGYSECFECPRYRASEPETILGDDEIMRWRPSIFMPRWASRIQLEVKKIRVERVQDISEKDAISEGIIYSAGGESKEFMERNSPKKCFERLWDSINKERGYGWDENPWVWVIEFKKLAQV